MDDKILAFIKDLKKQLEGIPGEEADVAVGYYEEYLIDAAEAGKDMDEILLQLGSPEKVASEIKAEASITRAKRSPGLKSFANVMKYAFTGITTPFAFLGTALFVIAAYCLVIIFFAGSAAIFAGAVGSLFMAVYEAFTIPAVYPLEIAGTIGMGLLCAGVCLLVSLGLYKLCRLLIIASAKVVQRMQKKPAVKAPETSTASGKRAKKPLRPAIIFTIITTAGLVLFFASGLPVRYFTIFNSMKPQNLAIETREYNKNEIKRISINTAHSCIKLEQGSSDKVAIRYEKPDWLDYEAGIIDGHLTFNESSNGRLSLFKIITLHESRTEVTVSLPAGYTPEAVMLDSTGGFITIKDMNGNITANTFTGSITLDNSSLAKSSYNVKASTGTGTLEVNGTPSGSRTEKGLEYSRSARASSTITLITARGNVSLKDK